MNEALTLVHEWWREAQNVERVVGDVAVEILLLGQF